MKLNFMHFFNKEKESLVEKVFQTAAVTLLMLYGAVIITMHGMQCYKWYTIRIQKKSYDAQSTTFDSAVKERAQLQQDKQRLQEKINFFNHQKKEQTVINSQLKSLYYDPTVLLKTVSIKDYHFACSFDAKTVQKAHQFLKDLKNQPLMSKAKIMHISKTDSAYGVSVKGKFKRS